MRADRSSWPGSVHEGAAHPHDELFVTGTVSSAGDGRAELTVRAATRAEVHAEAIAVVGLPPGGGTTIT